LPPEGSNLSYSSCAFEEPGSETVVQAYVLKKKKERKRKEPSIDLDRKVKCFCCNCDNKFKNNSRASGSQHDRLREYASWSRTSPRGGREQWERINDCTAEPCTMHNIRRALL